MTRSYSWYPLDQILRCQYPQHFILLHRVVKHLVSIVALIRRNFTKMWEKKIEVATHSKVFFNKFLDTKHMETNNIHGEGCQLKLGLITMGYLLSSLTSYQLLVMCLVLALFPEFRYPCLWRGGGYTIYERLLHQTRLEIFPILFCSEFGPCLHTMHQISCILGSLESRAGTMTNLM